MSVVSDKDIDELASPLRGILDAEIAAGNSVVETWRGWPSPQSICVMLRLPFRMPVKELPASVVYRDINDPRYWKAEFDHKETGHVLACGFGH